MARAKIVTPTQIQTAALALGVTLPIRTAFWKGTQIILRTRNGDYAYTPATKRKARTQKASA